jgi:hypothetical protein
MTTQVISAVSSGSVVSSSPVPSTKARVTTSGAPVFYAIGTAPVANSANCELIPANSVRYINMGGTDNYIAFLSQSGTGAVTVTAIGETFPRAIY